MHRRHFVTAVLFFILAFMTGCASLIPQDQKNGELPRKRIAITKYSNSVPAEIAKEYQYLIDVQNSQPSYFLPQITGDLNFPTALPTSNSNVESGSSQNPSSMLKRTMPSQRQPTNETSKSSSKKRKQIRVASKNYRVKPGDTLMKIAFENYGDLSFWRTIATDNKAIVQLPNQISPGLVLRLRAGETVLVSKNGLPYLIRKKDTLMRISSSLYGTFDYWEKLWLNNPELITDPNRIYAGFNLYYLKNPNDYLGLRNPASNKKISIKDQTRNAKLKSATKISNPLVVPLEVQQQPATLKNSNYPTSLRELQSIREKEAN